MISIGQKIAGARISVKPAEHGNLEDHPLHSTSGKADLAVGHSKRASWQRLATIVRVGTVGML
jgi:hypothetical protein